MSGLPVGQEDELRAAIVALCRGRVAQAQLIVGPVGSGKALFAETVAQAQFCDRRDSLGPPCGDCPACLAVHTRAHPDLHWISREGKFGIDEARAIAVATSVKPVKADVSVFVVEACERLTEHAAGALLKTLEDPPGPVLFLFLAAHPAQMEPTLRSRCTPVRLRPVTADKLHAWLAEQRPEVPAEDRQAAVRSSGGWPGLALQALEPASPVPAGDWASVLMDGLLASSMGGAMAAALRLAALGASPRLALGALRDALACHAGWAQPLSGLDQADVARLAACCSPPRLRHAVSACLRATEAEAANVNATLNWMVLLIHLRQLQAAC